MVHLIAAVNRYEPLRAAVSHFLEHVVQSNSLQALQSDSPTATERLGTRKPLPDTDSGERTLPIQVNVSEPSCGPASTEAPARPVITPAVRPRRPRRSWTDRPFALAHPPLKFPRGHEHEAPDDHGLYERLDVPLVVVYGHAEGFRGLRFPEQQAWMCLRRTVAGHGAKLAVGRASLPGAVHCVSSIAKNATVAGVLCLSSLRPEPVHSRPTGSSRSVWALLSAATTKAARRAISSRSAGLTDDRRLPIDRLPRGYARARLSCVRLIRPEEAG